MSIASDLEFALRQLDSHSAALLEQLVRDALALVQESPDGKKGPVDEKGWPVDHFAKYAGCLAGDNWEPPADPPPEPLPRL
jgi:hypothetical protein